MVFHLTFDIDWAPDWALEDLLSLLDAECVKATFFTTHDTYVNKIIEQAGHNLGIHPNFLPGSSQGDDVSEIIKNLLTLVPKATCIRTHSLVQSTPLFLEIFSIPSSLLYDFSLFTPSLGLFRKIPWNFNNIKFYRLNYQWEDDFYFDRDNYKWTNISHICPNSILDFHPIHICLNSSNHISYSKLKNRLNSIGINEIKRSDLDGLVNEKEGARDALMSIIKSKQCVSFEDLLFELD